MESSAFTLPPKERRRASTYSQSEIDRIIDLAITRTKASNCPLCLQEDNVQALSRDMAELKKLLFVGNGHEAWVTTIARVSDDMKSLKGDLRKILWTVVGAAITMVVSFIGFITLIGLYLVLLHSNDLLKLL